MNYPRSLRDADAVSTRLAMRSGLNIKPLADLVASFRAELGPGFLVPDFDPLDGGIGAEILFPLEAPGPKAGHFISGGNNDQTAQNFWQLNRDAGLDRKRTAMWNIVSYYIGTGQRIRAANGKDIAVGEPYLMRVLALLVVETIVLCGNAAKRAEAMLERISPHTRIVKTWRPSPVCLNRMPSRRPERLAELIGINLLRGDLPARGSGRAP